MDFLNKAFAQVSELFRSMTPAARVTGVLLVLVIVVSLAFLVRIQTSGSEEYLFGGQVFSASDLHEMQKIFANKGLGGFEIVGSRMKVDGSQKTAYWAALHDANFHVTDPSTTMEDAVGKMNPFISKNEREQRMKVAEDRQLSLILSRMNGIEAATVKIHVLDSGGLNRVLKTTSLATVKAVAGRHLTEEQVRAIRNAVAASNAALKPEDVAVLDSNKGFTWHGRDSSIMTQDDPYTAHKRFYEDHWKKKIENILSPYEGSLVEVNVELTPDLGTNTTIVTRDPKLLTTNSKASTLEKSSEGPEQGGRPGAVPNGVGPGNTPASVASSGAKSSETRSDEQINGVPTMQSHKTTSTAALIPQRVKAAIQVPKSYFAKVWRQQNPAKDGKQAEPDAVALRDLEQRIIKQIEESVVALFPTVPAGQDKYPDVTVRSFEDLPIAMAPMATAGDHAFTWFGSNWQAIGMTLVGLVSLLILRSMVKGAQPKPAEAAAAPQLSVVSADDDEDEEDVEEELDADGKPKRKFNSTGPNLRLELAAMIKEDPDAAANVLKNWIGDAA